MNRVQPPRERQSRHRPATIHLLRTAILNLGALAVTGLLVRAAIVIAVPHTTHGGLHFFDRATHVVVWPFQQIPPLDHTIGRGLSLADLAAIAVVLGCWFIAMGLVAGWEHESQRQSTGTSTSESGLRP